MINVNDDHPTWTWRNNINCLLFCDKEKSSESSRECTLDRLSWIKQSTVGEARRDFIRHCAMIQSCSLPRARWTRLAEREIHWMNNCWNDDALLELIARCRAFHWRSNLPEISLNWVKNRWRKAEIIWKISLKLEARFRMKFRWHVDKSSRRSATLISSHTHSLYLST